MPCLGLFSCSKRVRELQIVFGECSPNHLPVVVEQLEMNDAGEELYWGQGCKFSATTDSAKPDFWVSVKCLINKLTAKLSEIDKFHTKKRWVKIFDKLYKKFKDQQKIQDEQNPEIFDDFKLLLEKIFILLKNKGPNDVVAKMMADEIFENLDFEACFAGAYTKLQEMYLFNGSVRGISELLVRYRYQLVMDYVSEVVEYVKKKNKSVCFSCFHSDTREIAIGDGDMVHLNLWYFQSAHEYGFHCMPSYTRSLIDPALQNETVQRYVNRARLDGGKFTTFLRNHCLPEKLIGHVCATLEQYLQGYIRQIELSAKDVVQINAFLKELGITVNPNDWLDVCWRANGAEYWTFKDIFTNDQSRQSLLRTIASVACRDQRIVTIERFQISSLLTSNCSYEAIECHLKYIITDESLRQIFMRLVKFTTHRGRCEKGVGKYADNMDLLLNVMVSVSSDVDRHQLQLECVDIGNKLLQLVKGPLRRQQLADILEPISSSMAADAEVVELEAKAMARVESEDSVDEGAEEQKTSARAHQAYIIP